MLLAGALGYSTGVTGLIESGAVDLAKYRRVKNFARI